MWFFRHIPRQLQSGLLLRNDISCTAYQSVGVRNRGNRYFPALRSRCTGQRQTHTGHPSPSPRKSLAHPCFPSATPPVAAPLATLLYAFYLERIVDPGLRGLIYLNCSPDFHLPPRWWCALDTTMDPPPSRGSRSLTRTQHFALPLIDAAGRGCSIIRRRFAERQERKPLPFKSSLSLTGDCKFARSGCAFRAFSFLSSKPEHGIIRRRDNISRRIYIEGRVAKILLLGGELPKSYYFRWFILYFLVWY